jgi:hypothetical protein
VRTPENTSAIRMFCYCWSKAMPKKSASAAQHPSGSDERDMERINLYFPAETARELRHIAVDEKLRLRHLAEALIGMGLRDPAVLAKAVAAAREAQKKG